MARVLRVGRIAELTNRDLDEVCGTVTVARGLAYAQQGQVHDLELSDDGRLATGWVGGSRGQTYSTHIALVALTGPGRELVDTVVTEHTANETRMLSALTAAERGELDRIAGKLLTALESGD